MVMMDNRLKSHAALKDLSVADEEMLEAFFTFANAQLKRAVRTVNEMNKMLRAIRKDLGT